MATCATLDGIQRNHVDFDPENSEHLAAFEMLCLGVVEKRPGGFIHTKQHPTLRFNLEHPFQDVRTMMLHKVGLAYLDIKGRK